MVDHIVKQKLNVILLVDTSQSMAGLRIGQVNSAVKDIKDYLSNIQSENTTVDFYLTIIPFSTDASFYHGHKMENVDSLNFDKLSIGGWSNLHCAYMRLGEILQKENKGGIMPDFGGIAPIILLLTDGHPTGNQYKAELEKIKNISWFKAALRYGIAIELNDKRTMDVLNDFVGNNGEVISCYNANMLKDIIKIIVLTASKVRSSTSNVANGPHQVQNIQAKQLIAEALSETESWEW